MFHNNLISVIIPTYNSAKFLSQAIDSAIKQTYQHLEIIVVDDGSTDNTKEIIKRYIPKINYIEQINAGPARARNAGVYHARGQYIAFLDSDDIWLPNKIEMQMKVFSEKPDIALVYGKIVNFNNNTNEDLAEFPQECYSGNIFDHLLREQLIPLPSVLVRKKVLDTVGLFNETLLTAEDTNLWLRIAKNNIIIGINKVLVRRRRHETNLSERVDIPIGTLDNLDKIVQLFPETEPLIYYPMKQAYLNRGKGMMLDLFYCENYRKCRDVCHKLIHRNCFDFKVVFYWFLTILPSSVLNLFREIKRFLSTHRFE